MQHHTGSCLCQAIRFEIDGPLEPVQICHCQQCRKAQGTPLVTNIPVATSAFRLLAGSELLAEFESSPGKKRCFCRTCGSPVISRRDDRPDVVRVRATKQLVARRVRFVRAAPKPEVRPCPAPPWLTCIGVCALQDSARRAGLRK